MRLGFSGLQAYSGEELRLKHPNRLGPRGSFTFTTKSHLLWRAPPSSESLVSGCFPLFHSPFKMSFGRNGCGTLLDFSGLLVFGGKRCLLRSVVLSSVRNNP